jgi:ABC-type sugar transport system substrate-binding protein
LLVTVAGHLALLTMLLCVAALGNVAFAAKGGDTIAVALERAHAHNDYWRTTRRSTMATATAAATTGVEALGPIPSRRELGAANRCWGRHHLYRRPGP